MNETLISNCINLLERGCLVGYPTETVWGLAALPSRLDYLHTRKARSPSKPVQLSCASPKVALAFALHSEPLKALATFLPGPLTIIAPASTLCPPEVSVNGWVGLRVPAHTTAQELLQACGPLATTSLNPASSPPATSFLQAKAYALADVLLGDEETQVGKRASSVIKLDLENNKAVLSREGEIKIHQLAEVLQTFGVGVSLV